MTLRKRKRIKHVDKLAAVLACLLPQAQRDELRNAQVPAKDVLALFQWDHIVLYALDGSDEWWNIDPKLVATHREKSARDTAIVAKVKRLQKHSTWFRADDVDRLVNLMKPDRVKETKKRWPRRKIQSRGFTKQHRPLRLLP